MYFFRSVQQRYLYLPLLSSSLCWTVIPLREQMPQQQVYSVIWVLVISVKSKAFLFIRVQLAFVLHQPTRAFDSRYQKAENSQLMLCLCTDHLDKLEKYASLIALHDLTDSFSLIKLQNHQHWVWGKTQSLLTVTWSPVLSQCAVPLVIPVKLELVMVWRGGGVTETVPNLLKLYTQKLIFDNGCSNPSEVFRLPEPHLSAERFNQLSLIHKFISNAFCLRPSTTCHHPAYLQILSQKIDVTQWCEKFCIQ